MKKIRKKTYNWLPDFVYGGIDGAVTTFAVVAGVEGASLSSATILILGFANLFADGFSMGLSKYLSEKTKQEQHVKMERVCHYEKTDPAKGALATFISFLVIGFIPLIVYVFNPFLPLTIRQTFIATIIATLLALFIVGAVKSRFTARHWTISGLETASLGGAAAFISYLVGYLLRNVVI